MQYMNADKYIIKCYLVVFFNAATPCLSETWHKNPWLFTDFCFLHVVERVPLVTLHVGFKLPCFDYSVFPLGAHCFSFGFAAVLSPTSYWSFNNKPIISNKYLNWWRDRPDNGHIVEWDMSALTCAFISMNRFSDIWHWNMTGTVKVCREPVLLWLTDRKPLKLVGSIAPDWGGE